MLHAVNLSYQIGLQMETSVKTLDSTKVTEELTMDLLVESARTVRYILENK